MSIAPCQSQARRASGSCVASSARSASSTSARRPRAVIATAVASAPARFCRACTITSAPARASAMAIARPIPLDAPVTSPLAGQYRWQLGHESSRACVAPSGGMVAHHGGGQCWANHDVGRRRFAWRAAAASGVTRSAGQPPQRLQEHERQEDEVRVGRGDVAQHEGNFGCRKTVAFAADRSPAAARRPSRVEPSRSCNSQSVSQTNCAAPVE